MCKIMCDNVFLTVSYVKSPVEVWCIRTKDIEARVEVEEIISELQDSGDLEVVSEITNGLTYLGLMQDGREIRRGKVLKVRDDKAMISWIDYGGEDLIDSSQLYKLPHELHHLKAFCHQYFIHNHELAKSLALYQHLTEYDSLYCRVLTNVHTCDKMPVYIIDIDVDEFERLNEYVPKEKRSSHRASLLCEERDNAWVYHEIEGEEALATNSKSFDEEEERAESAEDEADADTALESDLTPQSSECSSDQPVVVRRHLFLDTFDIRFPQIALDSGKIYKGLVSHCDDNEFYIIPDASQCQLDFVREVIEATALEPLTPRQFMACLAPHQEGRNCRSVVLSCEWKEDLQVVTVQFVDYGSIQEVSDVYQLPPPLRRIPPLSYRCSPERPYELKELDEVFLLVTHWCEERIMVRMVEKEEAGEARVENGMTDEGISQVYLETVHSLTNIVYMREEDLKKLKCFDMALDCEHPYTLPKIPRTGEMCAALVTTPECKGLKRAQFIQPQGRNFLVHLVDYGTQLVKVNFIYKIDDSLKKMPPVCKRLSLCERQQKSEVFTRLKEIVSAKGIIEVCFTSEIHEGDVRVAEIPSLDQLDNEPREKNRLPLKGSFVMGDVYTCTLLECVSSGPEIEVHLRYYDDEKKVRRLASSIEDCFPNASLVESIELRKLYLARGRLPGHGSQIMFFRVFTRDFIEGGNIRCDMVDYCGNGIFELCELREIPADGANFEIPSLCLTARFCSQFSIFDINIAVKGLSSTLFYPLSTICSETFWPVFSGEILITGMTLENYVSRHLERQKHFAGLTSAMKDKSMKGDSSSGKRVSFSLCNVIHEIEFRDSERSCSDYE